MQTRMPRFFYLYSHKIFLYLFILTVILQGFFWYKTENIKPQYDIVPAVPSPYFIRAASLGDNQFLFRILSFRIQNAGDIFAGFVALKKYDYSRLYNWWSLLDELDFKSNLLPALVSYYFSQTQNKEDVTYAIKYIQNRANKDLNAKWWWLFQGSYLASNVMKNNALALEMAKQLSINTDPNAPLWTKQMYAFMNARYGNDCVAFKVISDMIEEDKNGVRKFSASDMNFMRHFVNERLRNLKNKNFDPKKCK